MRRQGPWWVANHVLAAWWSDLPWPPTDFEGTFELPAATLHMWFLVLLVMGGVGILLVHCLEWEWEDMVDRGPWRDIPGRRQPSSAGEIINKRQL